MTSILRQIIAGPRAKHPESNLDLCYVTPFIIATSGPSGTYPKRAYRNPLDQLVKFLDGKHGENWCIWEFRAEGTGYPDSEVYGRVRHYPWPDHHPPPFAIVPLVMSGMRKWLNEGKMPEVGVKDEQKRKYSKSESGRVTVVHCKAGKGRSGTIACSYLISECGWKVEEALVRFTERRMRPGFGPGVSIPSQLRWVGYVDRWTKGGKIYVERQIEILEVHVWGLREGVKVAVEGYIEEGKVIKPFHVFTKDERIVVDGNAPGGSGLAEVTSSMAGDNNGIRTPEDISSETPNLNGTSGSKMDKARRRIMQPVSATSPASSEPLSQATSEEAGEEAGGKAVVFKPSHSVVVPTSDVNIDFERRNRASYGLAMVTAVSHVWFNAFFEGNGPESGGHADDTGVFEIDWDKMDGIKGSLRKGTRALDRLAVIWRVYKLDGKDHNLDVIHELGDETSIPQMSPADWKGGNEEATGLGKDLGLRRESPKSANISKASSVKSLGEKELEESGVDDDSVNGVKTSGPAGDEDINIDPKDLPQPTKDAPMPEFGSIGRELDIASSTTPLLLSET